MKKTVSILLLMLAGLAGCASSESQLRAALQKNPDLVFEVIEKNPEKFLEVVNKAAQAAQRGQYEKQMAQLKAEQEKDIQTPRQPALSKARLLYGKEDAPITIVEYADFQCPYCSVAYKNLKKFAEKNPGKVRFYYKNMPLNIHDMADSSAVYFEALRLQGDEKARKFYEFVFENQRDLKNEEFLKTAAKKAGANMPKLEKDIKSEAIRKLINEDIAEFEKFGFSGTPAMIVNGVALSGAQPLEEIERIVALTEKK